MKKEGAVLLFSSKEFQFLHLKSLQFELIAQHVESLTRQVQSRCMYNKDKSKFEVDV